MLLALNTTAICKSQAFPLNFHLGERDVKISSNPLLAIAPEYSHTKGPLNPQLNLITFNFHPINAFYFSLKIPI